MGVQVRNHHCQEHLLVPLPLLPPPLPPPPQVLVPLPGSQGNCSCKVRHNVKITVMIQNFRTDRSRQTVQTQIRSSLIRIFTVCYSICIFLKKHNKLWSVFSNFRQITSKFSGVLKLRNFTVQFLDTLKIAVITLK